MKIGINGYFLTRSSTGFDSYTRGLLDAFAVLAPNDEFVVYVPKSVDYQPSPNQKIVVIPESKRLPKSFAKLYWEQWQLPRAAISEEVGLLHNVYPTYSILFKQLQQIVSIHDVIPWELPKYYQYSILAKLLRWFVKISTRKSDLIITISNYSKVSINKYFDIPLEKIIVIYNGIDERFRHQLTQESINNSLKKLNIPQPYILYVGGFDRRKNVKKLVESFISINSSIEHDLVIVGGPGPQPKLNRDFFELPEFIEKHKLSQRVHTTGVLNFEDLRAVYQGADIFVMPSIAEGFNLNVIEAQASNVPVIASNQSSTAEILNSKTDHQVALLIDCNRIDEISKAILKLTSDKQLRNALSQNGLNWQLRYSWKTTGEEILGIYRQLLNPKVG